MTEDETTKLAVAPDLPKGLIPGTGVALAHDATPVWAIVGNTVRVGNIMLVRLDPDATSQSKFRELAMHVEEFLERVASVSS